MSDKSKKLLAVIPARGGSKGILKKNLALFRGKPLLSHTIELAQRLTNVAKIVVSTDCPQIHNLSQSHGVDVHKRPEHLALDDTKMSEVLKQIASLPLFKNYQSILLLQPTSPLRKQETVQSAIDSFLNADKTFTSLVPLKKISAKVGHIRNNTYSPLFGIDKQRQEMEHLYSESGTVFLYDTAAILCSRIYERTFPFVVTEFQDCIDIDTEQDLIFAEAYANFLDLV